MGFFDFFMSDPLEDFCDTASYAYLMEKAVHAIIDNGALEKKGKYQGEHAIYVPMDILDRVFPLDAAVLNRMETVFSEDFKGVRVHTGPLAHHMTSKQGAKALTMGSEIYFSEGAYSPDTEEGQRLIAHELEHVRQFKKGLAPNTEEDREALEGAAYGIEKAGEDYFHNLETGTLSDSKNLLFSEKRSGGALMRESGSDGDEQLDDFSSRDRSKMIEIVMETTGRRYLITPEHKEKVIAEVQAALEDYLDNRFAFSSLEEQQELLNRLVGRGFIR